MPAPSLISSASATPARSGWFIALGIVFILLGLLAWSNVLVTTLASAVFIGVLLIIAGVVQLAHAFAHRGVAPAGRWFSGVIGLLYVLGGVAIIEEPVAGSLLLTGFLAACLIVAGIARLIWAGGHRRLRGWWGLLLSGVVTLLIGVLLYLSLPWSGLWALGTLVAVELVIGGISALTFGLSLRRLAAA